jgi:hypothetical protein
MSRAWLAGLAVVLLFMLSATPAQAAKSIGGFIGDTGGGTTTGGQFNQPRDVAVNLAGAGTADPGDTYVSEVGGRRVQVLDTNGNFKFAFGRDVIALNRPSDLGDVFEICVVAAHCKQGEPGTVTDGPGGEFNLNQGIAIDQATGRVYVQERSSSLTGGGAGNRRVQEFSADGVFLRAWGWDVVASGPGNTGGFEVCVAANGDLCQAATASGVAGGQFGAVTTNSNAIAVSPTNGHVFVGDPANRRVLEFDPTASGAAVFVRGWGWDVDKTTVDNRFEGCTNNCGAGVASTPANSNGAFTTTSPLHLVVDSAGTVYASDAAPTLTTQRVLRFDSDPPPGSPGDATSSLLTPIDAPPLFSGTPIPPIPGPANPTPATTPTIGLEIDPDVDGAGSDEESLLVARDPGAGSPTTDPTIVQEFDIPTQAGELPTDVVTVAATHTFAAGLSPAGLGVNASSGVIMLPGQFQPTPPTVSHGIFVLSEGGGNPPAIVSVSATDAQATTAVVQGIVNPEGLGRFRLQYSADGVTWDDAGPDRYLVGTTEQALTNALTGLSPNHIYRLRLLATKQTGLTTSNVTVSSESTFMTDSIAPSVRTLGATAIQRDAATLQGEVNPNGSTTTYYFEYGSTATYGRRMPAQPAVVGAGSQAVLTPVTVGGLEPGVTYHYRIVAENPVGVTVGSDKVFTTRVTAGPNARASELVSPPYKTGGAGVGTWYAHPASAALAGIAAYDGERFASSGLYGSILGDGAFAFADDWMFADRTSEGWLNHSPITHPSSAAQDYRMLRIQASTGDLSRVTWRSNEGLLRVFPGMETWPGNLDTSFIGSWDGRWEIFGPTSESQLLALDVGLYGTHLETVFSPDGMALAGSSEMVRGLEGSGDPTLSLPLDAPGPAVNPRNIWIADVSGPLADTLPGTGQRTLVNICAGGTTRPNVKVDGDLGEQGCTDGALTSLSGAAFQKEGSTSRGQSSALENAVSEGGHRVFFMSPDPLVPGVPNGMSTLCSGTGSLTVCPPQLFVRERDGDDVVTRWISKAQPGLFGVQDASLTGQAIFEGASSDGDKVYFRSNAPLTSDDPNGVKDAGGNVVPPPPGGVTTGQPSSQSWDLYRYDFPDDPDADPAAGSLTRVTAGPTGLGDGNGLQDTNLNAGMLRFLSEDGEVAYVTVSAALPGALDGNAGITTPGGDSGTADRTNLYRYDASKPLSQRWRFVARIPRAAGDGDGASTCASTGIARRSWLTTSNTGVAIERRDGANCVRGTEDGEFITFFTPGRLTADDLEAASGDVYAYDAETDELTRITASQGGAGGPYRCSDAPGDPLMCHGDGGMEISDPRRTANPMLGVATTPADDDDRVAFFQSRSRLSSNDTDDAYDVYEWRNGVLTLLTPGDSGFNDGQLYKGNDRTGTNVYVFTRDQMTWQDEDAVADIYSVRVDGGILQPVLPVLCGVLGDACQGPGTGVPVTAPVASGGLMGSAIGDADADVRGEVTVAGLTAAQRRSLAAGHSASVKVTVNRDGRISLKGFARIGKQKSALVLSAASSVAKAGTMRLRVKLSGDARRVLAKRSRLSVRLVTTFSAATRSVARSVVLRKPKSNLTPSGRQANVPANTNGR